MTWAVRIEKLGKRYRLRHAADAAPYRTLREDVASLAARLRRWGRGPGGTSEEFWALRDVNFEVQEGEVVGIIGRNGAGKSTLLKILSRVTRPTMGTARMRGRLGSLLEVGTGFHPELTGRENVFLSGAILGMTRREIVRKFDEIVAFSGVERFLDTPVKRYSSGMYVRLGFAVAAHLEPEILLVDEVLAVGDAAFQKKCLAKMESVAQAGRTILFVSHNLNAVSQLCSRAVLFQDGRVALVDDVDAVVESYLNRQDERRGDQTLSSWNAETRRTPFFTSIRINGTPLPGEVVASSLAPALIEVAGDSRGLKLRGLRVGIHLATADGVRLLSYGTPFSGIPDLDVTGAVHLECRIDQLPLIPGVYLVDVGCTTDGGQLDYVEQVGKLNIRADSGSWPGLLPTYKKHGYFAAEASWTVRHECAV